MWLSHFLVSATKVPELLQLVFNMELLAISSMSEVRSEHKVSFGASLKVLSLNIFSFSKVVT